MADSLQGSQDFSKSGMENKKPARKLTSYKARRASYFCSKDEPTSEPEQKKQCEKMHKAHAPRRASYFFSEDSTSKVDNTKMDPDTSISLQTFIEAEDETVSLFEQEEQSRVKELECRCTELKSETSVAKTLTNEVTEQLQKAQEQLVILEDECQQLSITESHRHESSSRLQACEQQELHWFHRHQELQCCLAVEAEQCNQSVTEYQALRCELTHKENHDEQQRSAHSALQQELAVARQGREVLESELLATQESIEEQTHISARTLEVLKNELAESQKSSLGSLAMASQRHSEFEEELAIGCQLRHAVSLGRQQFEDLESELTRARAHADETKQRSDDILKAHSRLHEDFSELQLEFVTAQEQYAEETCRRFAEAAEDCEPVSPLRQHATRLCSSLELAMGARPNDEVVLPMAQRPSSSSKLAMARLSPTLESLVGTRLSGHASRLEASLRPASLSRLECSPGPRSSPRQSDCLEMQHQTMLRSMDAGDLENPEAEDEVASEHDELPELLAAAESECETLVRDTCNAQNEISLLQCKVDPRSDWRGLEAQMNKYIESSLLSQELHEIEQAALHVEAELQEHTKKSEHRCMESSDGKLALRRQVTSIRALCQKLRDELDRVLAKLAKLKREHDSIQLECHELQAANSSLLEHEASGSGPESPVQAFPFVAGSFFDRWLKSTVSAESQARTMNLALTARSQVEPHGTKHANSGRTNSR